jgi:hypothetical protein
MTSAEQTTNKKGSHLTAEMRAKGTAALAQWRKERSSAIKKGGKALEKWNMKQAAKKASRKITPLMAIKAFCVDCVGGSIQEVTKCTNQKCNLYTNRPYQS